MPGMYLIEVSGQITEFCPKNSIKKSATAFGSSYDCEARMLNSHSRIQT